MDDNRIKGVSSRWKYFLILSSLLLLFLFLVVVFSIFIFLAFTKNDESSTTTTFQYKHSSIDHFTTETKYGFVHLNQKLSSDEYKSYRNDNTGTFNIIQHFGGEEYECSGSCFCSNERRTASSLLLTRGLVLLLSAFSTTAAVNIAKDTFTDECLQKYEDVCDSPSILHARVKKCTPPNKKKKSRIVPSEYEYLALEEGKEFRWYECEGYCVDNDSIFVEHVMEQKEELGDCENLSMTRRVAIRAVLESPEAESRQKARRIFAEDHLEYLCRGQSFVNWDLPTGDPIVDAAFPHILQVVLCMADLYNPKADNFQCVRISGPKEGRTKVKDEIEI